MPDFKDFAKKAADYIAEDQRQQQIKKQAKREKREAKLDRKLLSMWASARFQGGTRSFGMKHNERCTLKFNEDGLTVAPGFTPKIRVAWSDVVAIEATDASRTEISTRVSQQSYGGLAAPLFVTTPVGKTRSNFVGRSYVRVETSGGDVFVVLADKEAPKLEALLLATQDRRRQRAEAPTQLTETSPPDAFVQLQKLGELRDAGVLTDEEFNTKKAEILSRI